MLALVALYDELWSGVAVVGAPEVEDVHGVGHAAYTLWVFAVPILASSLIEVPLALWSDRARRSRVLRGGLLGLAGSLLLCAVADRPWMLAVGLSLAGAASGVACNAAEADLVARHPGGSARAMSRWVTFGAIGDALAPVIVGGAIALGHSYPLALVVIAGVVVVHAATIRPESDEVVAAADDEDEEERPSWRALLAQPRLWWVLFGAAVCTLLDEVVVAMIALRLARDLGATELAIAACLTACSAGAVVGAAATEWILARVAPRTWLLVSAAATLLSIAAVVVAPSPAWLLVAATILGVTCAPHYPLLQARAYDLVPGRPGLVAAASQVFTVLQVLLPLAVGLVAARWGTGVALASLAVQPVVVAVVALVVDRPGAPTQTPQAPPSRNP